MAQQKLTIGKWAGSLALRVLDKMTPKNSAAAPAVNAEFLGQIHVDDTAKTAYIAVAVGSATAANDWKLVTNV